MNHSLTTGVPSATDPACGSKQRSHKDLLRATREFTQEHRWRSWWYLSTTMAILVGLLTIAAIAPWWPLQLVAGVAASLVMVRAFILYHDYMHRSILSGSAVAAVVMHVFGMVLLAPARSWKSTHNHHHANVGKLTESGVGSIETMTVDRWRSSAQIERLRYRLERSVIIILLAYPVVFLFSVTLLPFLRHPVRFWDSLAAMVLHAGMIAGSWWIGGPSMTFFAVLLPFTISSAIGVYLFYVQHNAPGVRLFPSSDWSFHQAALESCSFLRLGRVMRWFTGDIGFHHVHHLNSRIPFYRLEETMKTIPECQRPPVVTTLWPRDILKCLRLKLWDAEAGQMVGFRATKPGQ